MDPEFRCTTCKFRENRMRTDDVETSSSAEQRKVEDSVEKCYSYFKNLLEIEQDIPELHVRRHEVFLMKGLTQLSQSYECLDASRPWLCYWILHSMFLLDIPISEDLSNNIANFLGKCQSKDGGFGGGPGQQPHLAPTYAAVNALCTLGTEHAFSIIDRPSLQRFLMSRHQPDGSYTMHESGEADIRGTYCAASAARLANVMTKEMFDGTPEWIVRCQTYEGGFGGCPGMEAHGGYSFCGLAALFMLGKQHLCDLQSVLRWLANKQMSFEGGFQGRTNKLVDGCYSFWQGGSFPLIHMILTKQGDEALSAEKWMFHQGALQEYVMICCQHPAGGLIDKPGKPRDYYHTCYCLSGLSVAQHFVEDRVFKDCSVGSSDNKIKMIHPIFNIGIEAAFNAQDYFSKLPVPSTRVNVSEETKLQTHDDINKKNESKTCET